MKNKIILVRNSFFVFFISTYMFSQSVGDYRSAGNGNWTALGSWEYYNGASWGVPTGTSPEGYPGQYSGTAAVLIQSGQIVTLNTAITTLPFGTLTIAGRLILTGDNSSVGMDFYLTTQSIIVTAPSGFIECNNKFNLRLPINASIQVATGGLDISSGCSANQVIYIGSDAYSKCNGGGSLPSFANLMSAGGTLNAIASSNSVGCQFNTISLVGSYSGVIGTITPGGASGVSYTWLIKDPNNVTSSSAVQNPNFSASLSGTYTAELTCSTYYGSTLFSNSKKVLIIVDAAPIITLQPINQLDCEGSIVNFKVVASGSGLSYVWQRKMPLDVGFTAIPTETNVSYPSSNEIRLANVGSALSKNGTQYRVLVSNGTCSVASAIATLSVNEITDVISPVLTPTQSILDVRLCYGANYSYTVSTSNPTGGPVVYQWMKKALSGGWVNVVDGAHFSGAKTITLNIINGTPNESADYRVDVVFNRTNGNCSVSSFSRGRLLTFLPLLTVPVAVVTQPNCKIATGTIEVTIQSATDIYSFDNGVKYQASNIKSGLIAGNYKIIIKNIGGCLSTTTSKVINASVISIWNGSLWLPSAPTVYDAMVFDGDYSSVADLFGCSCLVNAGVAVVFKAPHTVTITNEVTVTVGGSLIFESDQGIPSFPSNSASLIQVDNVSSNANSGNIKYERMTNSVVRNTDYTYWSSPVLGFTLGGVSPKTLSGKFYSFNSGTDDWQQESSATVMTAGNGYIIRGPEPGAGVPSPPFPYLAEFNGVPNNGHYAISGVVADRSFLLGNPYPSAIDANLFLAENKDVLYGTLYFWTHNTAVQDRNNILSTAGSGAFAYTSDDYASYNYTGGVAITMDPDNSLGTAAAPSAPTGINKNIPSGKIAAGQGFFAASKPSISVAEIVFNNDIRIAGTTGNNSQFFRFKAMSKEVVIADKNRIWLNLTNTKGAFKQTLLGYITGATNDFDDDFDGESYDGQEYVDFYSVNQDKNLVIQGRALPFDDGDEVVLGYRSTIDGDFSINIDQVDGFFTSQAVFLEDKLTNTIVDLKNGNYTFNTAVGTFNDRFVLRYTNKTLATNEVDLLNKAVVVSSKNKELKISSLLNPIDAVAIYDSSGRQIYKKTKVNSNQLVVNSPFVSKSVVLVQVTLLNGQSCTRKIIY